MNMLEEFDQKLLKAANTLEGLTNESQRVRTINELLESTDGYWSASLSRLGELQESMQAAAQELNKASDALQQGKEILEKADPSKIVAKLEAQSIELNQKLGEMEGNISKLIYKNEELLVSTAEIIKGREQEVDAELATIKRKVLSTSNMVNFLLAVMLGIAVAVAYPYLSYPPY